MVHYDMLGLKLTNVLICRANIFSRNVSRILEKNIVCLAEISRVFSLPSWLWSNFWLETQAASYKGTTLLQGAKKNHKLILTLTYDEITLKIFQTYF